MKSILSRTKVLGLFLGPVLFVIIYASGEPGVISDQGWRVIALAAWMVTWWISEAAPIPVTALLPLVMFPILGVFPLAESTTPYASPIIFLFMGGFMIALGMEKHQLHKRIALNLIRLTGTHANGIILGFMIATAALSMWISNTATTVMMLPIALSVIQLLTKDNSINTDSSQPFSRFALGLFLSIAYAANIGGTATIIGTPPNVVLVGFLNQRYGYELEFSRWLLIGIPIAATLIFFTYLIITRVMYPSRLGKIEGADEVIQSELRDLGPFSKEEKLVTMIFILTGFLWIFKNIINRLILVNLLGVAPVLHDSITAMIGGVLMFMMPVSFKKEQYLMEWEDTKRLPWGILLLFGGGLCLARGMESTGIVQLVGDTISQNQGITLLVLLAVLITVMLFMTELMSNVALTTIFVPMVLGIADGFELNPLILAIPVTLASSCAFMMPISTPPNAIVFASGYIRMKQMMKAGFVLNIISIIVLLIAGLTLIQFVYK